VQLYSRAKISFLQLVRNCQNQSKDDFTLKAEQAKMLKETYASMAKKKK